MTPPRPASALPASLSVVLPSYNEEAIIGTTVRGVFDVLARSGVADCEVIVVDDGSADDTAHSVESLREEFPGLRLLRHPRNLGYGAALRTGFDAATGEATVLMDSDGQFDPADILRLLEHWSPDAIVAGYRQHRSDNLMRTLNHRAFFTVVRMLFGRSLRDMNCAMKLFPTQIGQGLSADGAVISTQLVLRAQRAGYRVVEIPVRHLPRTTGSPTGANWRVVLRAFGELGRLRRDRTALDGLPPPRR